MVMVMNIVMIMALLSISVMVMVTNIVMVMVNQSIHTYLSELIAYRKSGLFPPFLDLYNVN